MFDDRDRLKLSEPEVFQELPGRGRVGDGRALELGLPLTQGLAGLRLEVGDDGFSHRLGSQRHAASMR
jgi:hypothetical protein